MVALLTMARTPSNVYRVVSCQIVRRNRNSSAFHPSCRLRAGGDGDNTTAHDMVVKRFGHRQRSIHVSQVRTKVVVVVV